MTHYFVCNKCGFVRQWISKTPPKGSCQDCNAKSWKYFGTVPPKQQKRKAPKQDNEDTRYATAVKADLRKVIPQYRVAKEIQGIIKNNRDLKRKREVQNLFQLIFFLHHRAEELANRFGPKTPLERASLSAAIQKEFEVEEVLDASVMDVSQDYIEMFLMQGWSDVMKQWKGLKGSEEKIKFIDDIFDSTKGYAKTIRIIPAWKPPKRVNLKTLLENWLRRSSNDSIFTADRIKGSPKSNIDQIKDSYKDESKDGKKYCHMWGLVLNEIQKAKGFDKSSSSKHQKQMHAYLKEEILNLHSVFAKLIGSREIRKFVINKFDEVYKNLY
jgi:hypothetical protein